MSDAIAAIAAVVSPVAHGDDMHVAPAKTAPANETESDATLAFAGALASAMTLLTAPPILAKPPEVKPTEASGSSSNLKPTVAQSDLTALTPEMRTRLERVVSRMKAEYGHDVQVVETARSPERQDELFAQGRTRPGPVVTWTLDSRHITGNAADVVVDHSYQGSVAYEHLARIAQEEGLHTLGAKDPGHVELARSSKTTELPAKSVLAKAAVAPDLLAPVAQVAGVARVADVARVAEVAPPKKVVPRAAQPAPVVETLANTRSDAPAPVSVAAPALASALPHAATTVQAVHPSEAAERVARVLQLQDASAVRSPTSVLLRFDDNTDGVSSVRVGLRGNSVDAALGFMNQSDATRVESRFGELQQALGRHGLSGDSLTARAISSADPLTTIAAFAGDGARREQGGSSSRQDGQFAREREAAAFYDDQRRQQRSRRQSTGQQQ